MKVRGARVLITGASRGLGKALAVAFAESGATVALVARDSGAIEALAAELGGTAHAADLADPTQVADLVSRVEKVSGPVDVLVNNAAITRWGNFATSSAQELRRITEVNYLAPAELSRQVLPGMLMRGSGQIVNISSLVASVAVPGTAGYSASKAALAHFTAALRSDLHGTPIGTTLVDLGAMPTGMGADAGDYAPARHAFARLRRTRLLGGVPPETVAAEVVAAVRHDRRHVRLPRRGAVAPMLVEAPRRASEFLLADIPRRLGR